MIINSFHSDLIVDSGGINNIVWIGLDNLRSDNVTNYTWIDGTPLNFVNWYPGRYIDS